MGSNLCTSIPYGEQTLAEITKLWVTSVRSRHKSLRKQPSNLHLKGNTSTEFTEWVSRSFFAEMALASTNSTFLRYVCLFELGFRPFGCLACPHWYSCWFSWCLLHKAFFETAVKPPFEREHKHWIHWVDVHNMIEFIFPEKQSALSSAFSSRNTHLACE